MHEILGYVYQQQADFAEYDWVGKMVADVKATDYWALMRRALELLKVRRGRR